MIAAEHKELCILMGAPDSERLASIWSLIVEPDEAALLLAMPGTAQDLAEKIGQPEQGLVERLDKLFYRGVVFVADKPQGRLYRAPRHLIQLHDASNQWPEAPAEFTAHWKAFMNEEYPKLLAAWLAAGFPSFMRVVPGLQVSADLEGLNPADDLAAMIATASDLAVVDCPCSRVEAECDRPLQRCLQVGRGAEYVLARGTGRALDRQQALTLLREASDAGLVHMVENKQGLGTVICSCCTCCCAMLKPGMNDPACKPVVAPSRYLALVQADMCTGDGLCEDACPVGAVVVSGDVAEVNPAACLGCGLCLVACPTEAIRLAAERPLDFIPA